MPDLVDRIRSELDDRIATLRPVAAEFALLERAAAALDDLPDTAGSPTFPPPARPARGAAHPRTSVKRARRGHPAPPGKERAAPGQTQLRVIDRLRSHPGSTSTAVAAALEISANAAAATISRLVKQGRVRRLETGGYAAAEAPSDGAAEA